MHSLGLSQRAFKDKATFNLSVMSPFRRDLHFGDDIETPTFSHHSDSYANVRQVRLGITYNFGKTQVAVKKARRGIQNDDLKSGESGGSGSGSGGTPGASQ